MCKVELSKSVAFIGLVWLGNCTKVLAQPHLKQDFDGEDASEPVVEVGQLLVPAAVGVDRILGC